MISLRDRLAADDPVVMDGAMGTLLRSRGHGEPCPEAVNRTRPDVLEGIAREFLEAGAEILQANTFGGSRLRLRASGLDRDVEEINRSAVRVARRVAGDRAWVTGSCGPCGLALDPHGDLERADLRASLAQQISILAESGVDAISVETMTDLEEACLAVAVAREVAPAIVVLASMTYRWTPEGYFTHSGAPLPEAILRLEAAGADAIGATCGTGMREMLPVAMALRAGATKPVLIRPSAGIPEASEGEPVWPETPREFGEGAHVLLGLGVTLLGGCCGTTPDHVRAIREAVDAWRS